MSSKCAHRGALCKSTWLEAMLMHIPTNAQSLSYDRKDMMDKNPPDIYLMTVSYI